MFGEKLMKRICFVGASTTEEMGDPSGRGWVGNTAIVKNQTAACYNLGVRGQTIFQIADRAAAECNSRILEYQSGGIVLGCALNEIARLADGTHRASQTAILNCYSVLIAELAEIAPLVIIGPPPVLQTQMPFYSPASGLSLDFRNQDIEAIDTLIRQ
jgi:acyl-CoA thioesterase-1